MKTDKNCKIKKSLAVLMTVLTLGNIYGCGPADTPPDEVKEISYLDTLEDGLIYIRHRDEVCENVYVGETTFPKEKITNSASAERLCWFKDDWNKIPVLYQGESLILYTEGVLSENFVFERFCDVGYTIGLRVQQVTKTGRLQLSTDVNNNLTYPYGDTDDINDLPNEVVIMETLGGKKLRISDNLLSSYGTFLNLAQGESYEAEIYNGTVLSKYTFKADTRVLGSMEIIADNDYEFESGRIITITIPEWFESGYYMINGQGLFRYEKDAIYDEESKQYIITTIDYNIPNSPPEEEKDKFSEMKDVVIKYEEDDDSENLIEENIPVTKVEEREFDYISTIYDEAEGAYITTTTKLKSNGNKFEVDVPISGYIKIAVAFTGYDGTEAIYTSAGVTTPDERYYQLQNKVDHLEVCFEASEAGVYQLIFYDLGQNIPEITIQEIKIAQ